MRTLYVKQDLAASGTTVIHDHHQQPQYLLTGKWGNRLDALSVYQLSGQLEAEIKQTSLGLLPRFSLFYHQQRVGRLHWSLGVVHEVHYVRDLNWIILGNQATGRFRVIHGTETLMTMQTVALAKGDYLELTVQSESYEPLMICLAVILDRWARRRDKHRFPTLRWGHSQNNPLTSYTLKLTVSEKTKKPQRHPNF
ncbi:LURP-one-related/scramblase family protein [Levilactobacillus bambusae]|uniref:Uncharacterized protein n=1 Tax=Levilactobacillus bambusae TaxID=2024736 RepID=A0A2V1MXA2_9LACO|nr:hypothetical protein [Levilactobacillus bambusae]PWF99452.1 hypothetical protein DCM90_08350 [Levilactobacillus bambusae]